VLEDPQREGMYRVSLIRALSPFMDTTVWSYAVFTLTKLLLYLNEG
jgi:hypothetical protein